MNGIDWSGSISDLKSLISLKFYFFQCILKSYVFLNTSHTFLECIYTEIGGIFPLGINLCLPIDMNTYIYIYINNFDLYQIRE